MAQKIWKNLKIAETWNLFSASVDGVSVEFLFFCWKIFLAKINPAKNIPPGNYFERRIIRRGILLAKNTPIEEYS
jgi:hypothetical protein